MKTAELKVLPVTVLKPAEYNPRKKLKPGDKEYEKIKNSIEEFGFADPLVVNADMTIIGGHQRLTVAQDLGYTEVPCAVVDVDKTREKALNIALNKITGAWDENLLADLLKDIQDSDFDLGFTGFDPPEIETLFNKVHTKDVEEDDFDVEEELSQPVFSKLQETLSAYKLGCMIKVSNELLNDSAFDIAAHIAHRFGVRFGNAEEDAFINGTGPSANPQTTPSQPTGILTSLTPTAGNTTANAQTVHFDNIYKLYYSLKSPYRRNASFLCNETLLLQLMLIKDKNDNYIWKPGLEIGKPDTILGRPIYTSGYMPAITGTATQDKGKKVLLFGDFSYYWIADRQNRTLKRLNELYAVTDQVGFIGTQRVDGKLILPEAMQVMALGSGTATNG